MGKNPPTENRMDLLAEMNSSMILPTGLPSFCINYLVEWMTHSGVSLYGDGQGEVDVGCHEDVGQGQHVGHHRGEHQGRGDAAITQLFEI